MKENEVLIIIPVYNEEKNIIKVISNIRKLYSYISICVINDNSTDDTRNVVLALRDINLYLLNHPIQQGYGVAIQTGYKYALQHKYKYVLQMDGDGQHDPIYIPAFLKAIDYNIDVIIGSRFKNNNSLREMPFLKRIAILFFRHLIFRIIGIKITDPTSGFQLLNSRVMLFYISDFFPLEFPDANLICWTAKTGFKLREIFIKMKPRLSGKSMHKGLYKNLFYMYKVTFLCLLSVLKRRIY